MLTADYRHPEIGMDFQKPTLEILLISCHMANHKSTIIQEIKKKLMQAANTFHLNFIFLYNFLKTHEGNIKHLKRFSQNPINGNI